MLSTSKLNQIQPQNQNQNLVNKNQTHFSRLCKDLYKFIKKHIIKGYIIDSSKEINDQKLPSIWSYHNIAEKKILTKKDKSLDIFKDDDFLVLAQKAYESLGNVIEKMDDNRKNVEFIKKDIELGEKKMKLLSELNSHLNLFFDKTKNINIGNNKKSLEDNKLMEHLNLAKSFDILNNLNIINNINEFNQNNNNIGINTKNKEKIKE